MTNLERWVDALVDEFDLDPGVVDMGAVLDLARDAAHGVERPAAPLTTFVAGYVAGMAAGEGADHPIEDVMARATELALAWTEEPALPEPPSTGRTEG
ncbi:molybdopterin-guanine dinucleotide biosynthesis protein [Cellulosimicrobium terreum]|nr:molybdopterin-guanine dinucleotide biosynthesis protein [Cellulosimicrobium terreum]